MTTSVILTLKGITALYTLGRVLAPRLAQVDWVSVLKGVGIRSGGVAAGVTVGTLGAVFASGLAVGVLFAPARGADLRRSLRDWVEERRRRLELVAPVCEPVEPRT